MKGKKISLEEYLKVFHLAKQVDLSLNEGNQILSMHGFKKVKVKPELPKAMESLDLINLSRSTLTEEEVCSCALMNLEEIIADVGELDWKDCCITSFETVDFSSNNQRSNSDPSLAPHSGSNDRLGARRSASTGNLRKRKKDC